MAREVKDELNPSEPPEPLSDQHAPAPPQENSVQIQMTPELEENLIDIVLEDFEASKKARNERDYGTTSRGSKLDFVRWRKELLDLYNAERIPKTVPWKFCSNRSLRIAKAILDMLHARLFPSICNEYLLKFKAENVASFPKCERVSKLMKWWLFVHCRVRGFFDMWVKNNLAWGDTLTETSWEAVPKDMGHTEQVPVTDEMGTPVMEPDGMTPSVMTRRKIDLIEKSMSRVYTRDKFYLQAGSKNIQREPVILEDEYFYRDLEEGEAKGQFVNITNLLREKLPFAKDEHTGLSPEALEKLRDVKLRNQPVKILKWFGNFDADGDGFAEDVRVYISEEYNLYLGGVAMTNITKSGMRPLDFTKIEDRLENTEENFGYGVLETVKEMAEEVDALFNQMADENTLNVMRPGFYDPGGDLDAPALSLSPNRMSPVSDPQRNVFFPQMQSNADKIIMAIRLVIEFIERLTAASSYVMGKESEIVGGSGTATRTNAIVNAANERFGMPAGRLRAGAANIVRQHLDILQLNIPPGLEQRILEDDGSPLFAPNELSMDGISGEYDAYLLPDPSAGSKEAEQQIAQMFLTILSQSPIVMSNPTLIYRIEAEFIKSYGKEPAWYLGPEPDADMIDDPQQENTLMVQGDFKRVQAQLPENHMQHIQKHQELLESPTMFQLPPALAMQIQTYAQQHIQQHMMMQQMVQGLMNKVGGGKSGSGSKPGGESGGQGGLQGPGQQSGLEQVPGPLGQALNTKRAGESGSSQKRQSE